MRDTGQFKDPSFGKKFYSWKKKKNVWLKITRLLSNSYRHGRSFESPEPIFIHYNLQEIYLKVNRD